MLTTIQFTCPVYVVVDTELGEIARVVVGDDQLDDDTAQAFFTEDGGIADDAQANAAWKCYQHLDEIGVMWPSWEFGW